MASQQPLLFTIAAKRKKTAPKGHQRTVIPDNNQIYVGNLHYNVQRNKLKETFMPFGNIQEVRIIQNNKTGRSKGFAFVSFASPAEAQKALKMHGRELLGRSLVVRIAKKRENN